MPVQCWSVDKLWLYLCFCLITCPNLETIVCLNFLSRTDFLTGISDMSGADFPKMFDQCQVVQACQLLLLLITTQIRA